MIETLHHCSWCKITCIGYSDRESQGVEFQGADRGGCREDRRYWCSCVDREWRESMGIPWDSDCTFNACLWNHRGGTLLQICGRNPHF